MANKANLIAERYEDIVDFVKEAQSSNTNKFLYVGKIGEILSQDINKSTGIKIKGYNIVLNSHYIKHIFKSHGNVNVETSRGQVAVTNDNILNILDTILTPQNVKLDRDKSVVAIIFKKTIGGKHTAVTLLSTGKTRLTLKTAWINKRGGALSPTANDADKSAVSQTPDDGRSTHSTNISISTPAEKSNTFVKNSQNIHKKGEKSFSLPDTESEGRKLITNRKPTANEDIRFSLKDGTAASISSVDADKTIVFHGTKYRFDKFLAEHIGTGEGRQAHGWGLYFAADRTTADRYSRQDGHKYYINNKLITDDFESVAAGRIFDFDGKKIPIKEVINDIGNSFSNPQNANKLIEIVKKIYNDVEVSKGNIYTVTIPSENTMLWENKSLSEQPLKVREAMEEYSRERNKKGWSGVSETSGRYIYKDAVFEAQMNGAENPEKAASLLLNSLGINGIVYDGRQDGRSYVVFDDNAVRMLDRVKVVNGEDVKFALKDIDKSTKAKYNDEKRQYSKKNSLINKTFPPYNESFSEANERATRWAKQERIKEGWQKLVSYHDKWYVVEKFSDMENGYLIVETIKNSEYERIANIMKSYEGSVSYGESVDEGISLYENERGKQGFDSNQTQKGQTESRVSQVAESRNARKPGGEQTRRDSGESGGVEQGSDRGLKYSLPNAPYKADVITNVYEKVNGLFYPYCSPLLAHINI